MSTPLSPAPRGRGRGRAWKSWAAVALGGVATVIALVLLDDRIGGSPAVVVTASSAAGAVDPHDLIRAAQELAEPSPAPRSPIDGATGTNDYSAWHEGEITWASEGPAAGTWLRLEWSSPQAISHIRIDGAGGPQHAYTAAVITFDDGASVWVTPDAHGNVSVGVERRMATSATVRFVDGAPGAETVALRALRFDDSGGAVALAGVEPAASSATAGGPVSGLSDGDIAAGTVGAPWIAEPSDTAPWLGLTWTQPAAVSSVSIVGSTADRGSLHGTLVFSDGSSLPVSGVTSGDQSLTTIAFTPRYVTWVRLDVIDGEGEVSEFRVQPEGQTPPAWPATGDAESSPVSGGACSATAHAVGDAAGSELSLVCPSTGTEVSGDTVLVVHAAAHDTVTASAWAAADGAVREIAATTADERGRATLEFTSDGLQQGPLAVRVESTSAEAPLYVQLYNSSGTRSTDDDGYAPEGMTLQYEDDFTTPLSITADGQGATYAATKPDAGGGADFGDAVFADPSWGTDSVSTLDGEYLRIRVEPLGAREDPWGWDREYLGGILSSARVGGSGFAAQYGYFEARILAPAATGSWPAFWMLDTESARAPADASGEVDAVEFYGHNPVGSCHTAHSWLAEEDAVGTACFHDNGAGDWALEWHTYGVQIRPDGADMFIDGVLITSWSNLEPDSTPYFFLFDLALGGGWPVDLMPQGGEIEMYVDWVRVYT